MLLPIKWSKEFINIDKDLMQICDKVTLTGSHVESINEFKNKFTNIVLGKIIEIYKHANSKKLWITKVDVGNKILQIVTGAQNLILNDYVPVALVGAKLYDGTIINETTLVGEKSEGMFCSYKELGYKDSVIPKEYKNGVLRIFGDDLILGTNIKDILDSDDAIVEFEITPNRPDCISILGMSREIAASFGEKIVYPKLKNLDDYEMESIKINNKVDSCKKYSYAKISNVKIQESNRNIQNHLINCEIRPINNVVDITNYIMLEYGQPIHAYDFDKIDGDIYIRYALNGEKVITIDDQEVTLSDKDMLICDSKKPIAIAGIMGLKNSEVDSNTTNVLLESAVFDKNTIKNSSKRLNIKTEASIRFEKGCSNSFSYDAIKRALYILDEYNIKIDSVFTVEKELSNLNNKNIIDLDYNLINKLLGTNISVDEMINLLNNLEIKSNINNQRLICEIPSFRSDLSIPEDIVEEVGRLYGFQNIKSEPILSKNTIGRKSKKRVFYDKIKNVLYGLGLYEITTYSFMGSSIISKSNMDEENVVKIINPLGEEFSIMRKSILPNIFEVLSKNLKYKNKDLIVYELGNTFHSNDINKVPDEIKKLSVGCYGKYDFYYLKDIVINILNSLNIKNYEFRRNKNIDFLHSGVSADIYVEGILCGNIGQVSYDVCKNFQIKENVFVFEINLEKIYYSYNNEIIYKPIIKYPSVNRDIALVVDKNIDSGDIEKIIKSNSCDILKKVILFDIYEGNQVEDNKKSLAYNLVFQSSNKTLVDDDINTIIEKILKDLKQELNAELRS